MFGPRIFLKSILRPIFLGNKKLIIQFTVRTEPVYVGMILGSIILYLSLREMGLYSITIEVTWVLLKTLAKKKHGEMFLK